MAICLCSHAAVYLLKRKKDLSLGKAQVLFFFFCNGIPMLLKNYKIILGGACHGGKIKELSLCIPPKMGLIESKVEKDLPFGNIL